MAEFEIKIDTTQRARLAKVTTITQLERSLRSAAMRAGRKLRTRAVREMTREYTPPRRVLVRYMYSKYSNGVFTFGVLGDPTKNKVEAQSANHKQISIRHYGINAASAIKAQNRRPYGGLVYTVRKGTSPEILPRAFFIKNKKLVMQRTGKSRYPIESLVGPTAGALAQNVIQRLNLIEFARDAMRKEIESQISRWSKGNA